MVKTDIIQTDLVGDFEMLLAVDTPIILPGLAHAQNHARHMQNWQEGPPKRLQVSHSRHGTASHKIWLAQTW